MSILAVPKEAATEQRVALVPSVLNKIPSSVHIHLQTAAGLLAGHGDLTYKNVTIANDKKQLLSQADIILRVQAPDVQEVELYKSGAIVVALLAPYKNDELIKAFCRKSITSFAMELVPRISRAQSMDVLSSQAAVAGYKAVLLGANQYTGFFPMLTTAAGTVRPAQVLIIGAGVAGLQAIATAKRLGAQVEAYDIRPEAREQIESLGAKMVKLDIDARGTGGYARELTAEEQATQQQILAQHVARASVVICTAAIPGRKAPKIITAAMVEKMQEGSVIVDIAAETGGNCELTEAGKNVKKHGVTIMGPLNLAAELARDASELYARNLVAFIQNIFDKEGKIHFDWQDEILAGTVLTHEGIIKHEATRKRLEGATT